MDDGTTDKMVLMSAAKAGYSKRMRHLITEKQLDPNLQDEHGWSLLHWAAWNSHPECVVVLLNSGADPNQRDGKGISPLMLAMESTSKQTISALLEKGADLNAQDSLGQTPLMHASLGKSPTLCTVLLDHPSINLDIRDKHGMTALMHAALAGNSRVIGHILQRGGNPCVTRECKLANGKVVQEKASDIAKRSGHYRHSMVLLRAEEAWCNMNRTI